jgi:hypothetical protein
MRKVRTVRNGESMAARMVVDDVRTANFNLSLGSGGLNHSRNGTFQHRMPMEAHARSKIPWEISECHLGSTGNISFRSWVILFSWM